MCVPVEPGSYLYYPVQEAAFRRAPWGRRRNRYPGENRGPGIRTEKVRGEVCHFADFSANLCGRLLTVRYPDGQIVGYPMTANGTTRIDGVVVRRPADGGAVIKPRHLARYYRAPIPEGSRIAWFWDPRKGRGAYRTIDGRYAETTPWPEGPAAAYYFHAARALAFQAKARALGSARPGTIGRAFATLGMHIPEWPADCAFPR